MDIELKVVRHDKMFSFVDCYWQPITGCLHNCTYCWARKKAKYQGKERNLFFPAFHPRTLSHKFDPETVVFVVSEGDVFSPCVNDYWVQSVLTKISLCKDTVFLMMTKNPLGYIRWENWLPDNVIAGVTIETDNDTGRFSQAPKPWERFDHFANLRHRHKLLVAEPVMDFNLDLFLRKTLQVNPKWFAIGYDNYDNLNLPEPSLAKVESLISTLEEHGIIVFRKTLREGRV